MNTPAPARRGALRSPWLQDAGLAALLLAGTVAVAGSAGGVAPGRAVAGGVATALGVAAVAARRRWPVPAVGAALVGAVVRIALGAGPTPAELAVLVTLYTVAARRPRRTSLVVLGAALAVVTAWTLVVAADGGGRLLGGPFGTGGETVGETPGGAATGPGSWGGILVLGPLLAGSWALGWGVRSRRAYLGELEARARDLERERDQQAALAVAAERARLTREMHDVVAHGLAVIVTQAQGGAAAFERRPADTLAALDAIVATGRESLADMRHAAGAGAGRRAGRPAGRRPTSGTRPRGAGRPRRPRAPGGHARRPARRRRPAPPGGYVGRRGVPHPPGVADEHDAARGARRRGPGARLVR
ncbi:histidine kinase [Isoptericola sp. NPDC057653]|uniref:histidine kinase n=1 Tax=Isoptericola sp. NPDC057653 TaxID=3346195 RepID=UPI0036AE9095